MKHIPVSEGIAAAAAFAAINVAADFIARITFGWHTAVKTNIALLAMLYLGYLFYRSDIRAGKMILGAGCMALLIAAAVFIDTQSGMLAAAVIVIWAMRSLLYAAGLLSAFAHLALCVLGAAFAGYAAISGSGAATAAWCFFLTQSLWVLIPKRIDKLRQRPQSIAETNRFNRAYKMAEAAIEQLAETS